MVRRTRKITQSMYELISSSKYALFLISTIAGLIILDFQFVNITYGTTLGTPNNYHLLLFLSLVICGSVINIILMSLANGSESQTRNIKPLLYRFGYFGTLLVQGAIMLILFAVIAEILILSQFRSLSLISVVYLSHIFSAGMLGVLTFTFLHWFKITRSTPMLIYAIVFIVVIFLLLLTIPLLTEQYRNQPKMIYPRSYTTLIDAIIVPSPTIAFVYGLGSYALPVMILASWILTVSLLKSYARKIGKKRFWLLVSLPLVYELFTYITNHSNLLTEPSLVQVIYSRPFLFLTGISYQISGLFFAISFLAVARVVRPKVLKTYLIISSIGIVSLFSSMQPGMPFYAAYPPFGLVTLLFLGLSSYLLMVGILGSAAYISTDSELRREVYKSINVDSDFIKMGKAEMQRRIGLRVRATLKKVKLADELETRVETDEDIRAMIDEALDEIHHNRLHNDPEK